MVITGDMLKSMSSWSRLLLLLAQLSIKVLAQRQAILHDVDIEFQKAPFTTEFNEYIKHVLDDWKVPGIAIGVIDGEEIHTKGYGIATFPSEPVTPDTLFYVGSTTKAFTAVAMALIVHNSTLSGSTKVTWETPISHILPGDFVLPDEYASSRATIEDALSHRTGMGRHDSSYGGLYEGEEGKIRRGVPLDIVRSLRGLPMFSTLRTKFHYCNMMFVTVGCVIEKVTGNPLGEFFHGHIWAPLEMNSTYFSLEAGLNSSNHLAQGYLYNNSANEYVPVRFGDLYMPHGAGGIASSVADYTKWIHAFLHGSNPLSESIISSVLSPRMLVGPTTAPFTGPSSYGLGWFTRVYRGYEIYEHDGEMEAYGTYVIFIPKLKYGVVAFANTAATGNYACTEALFRLIDEKIGTTKEGRFDWNTHNHQRYNNGTRDYENAMEKYYPHVPSPPLPPSLHLVNYTGTYHQSAYRNWTVVLKDKETLYINRTDITFSIEIDIKHVSGDYFMAYIDSPIAKGSIFREAWPASFKIDSTGKAAALGISLEDGVDTLWFERIE